MCWCQNIEKCLIAKPPCSNSKNQTLMPHLTVHVYASHYLFLFGKGMYVDDTLTALPKDKVQHFHEHLNSIESTIQFTVEMEPEGTLPFLDTRIMHQSDGFLPTMVLRRAHTQTSTWTFNLITPWHTRWQWPAPYSTVLRRSAQTSQIQRREGKCCEGTPEQRLPQKASGEELTSTTTLTTARAGPTHSHCHPTVRPSPI